MQQSRSGRCTLRAARDFEDVVASDHPDACTGQISLAQTTDDVADGSIRVRGTEVPDEPSTASQVRREEFDDTWEPLVVTGVGVVGLPHLGKGERPFGERVESEVIDSPTIGQGLGRLESITRADPAAAYGDRLTHPAPSGATTTAVTA